jgi:hypothetical protein
MIVCLANHPCVTMPSSVCQNGGTCTVNGADYLCNCAAGWSGPNCQTPGSMLFFVAQHILKTINQCFSSAFFQSNQFM